LKACLLRARNLRVLTLHMKSDGDLPDIPTSDHKDGEMNLQLEEGDRFPAIEELNLYDCYNSYYLSATHCATWVNCMDWSRLRVLDLGHWSPQYLLPALTSQVVHLKVLRFGFWPNYCDPVASWNSPNVNVIRQIPRCDRCAGDGHAV
jgi:hypothetical protein